MRILLPVLLLLTGCLSDEEYSTRAARGITRHEFPADGVVCYTYFQNSISCVRR
jgi:hypothetical protein